MNEQRYALEFITPCFCAGADQSKAEIRAPSIRGQLRWWFRILGGTPEQERNVFGGVRDKAQASAVVVRVSGQETHSDTNDLPRWSGNAANDPLGYLSYFAKESGKGIRWKAGAFLSPGSSFIVRFLWRRTPSEPDAKLLDQAVTAWMRLGGLGLRARRGFGAVRDTEADIDEAEFLRWARALPGIQVAPVAPCRAHGGKAWDGAMRDLGKFLKEFRKDNELKGEKATVLGCSNPRIASSLLLRPVWLSEGLLPVACYAENALPPEFDQGRRELEAFFARR